MIAVHLKRKNHNGKRRFNEGKNSKNTEKETKKENLKSAKRVTRRKEGRKDEKMKKNEGENFWGFDV